MIYLKEFKGFSTPKSKSKAESPLPILKMG